SHSVYFVTHSLHDARLIWISGGSATTAAPEGAEADRPVWGAGADVRGLHPPADALRLHRVHAAVGLPELPCREGRPLSDILITEDRKSTRLYSSQGRYTDD